MINNFRGDTTYFADRVYGAYFEAITALDAIYLVNRIFILAAAGDTGNGALSGTKRAADTFGFIN
jgi:hypothetical protein